MNGYDLSIAERQKIFNDLKAKGKLKGLSNLGDAQFLNHAEANAILRAHDKRGTLGKTIVLYVDRPTCPNCQDYLMDLASDLGIEEIVIFWKNQAKPPLRLPKRRP